MSPLARLVPTVRAEARVRWGAAALLVLVIAVTLGPALLGGGQPGLTDIVARRFIAPLGRTAGGPVHLLGTDRFGRDILRALLAGGRISLLVGLLAAAVSLAIGVLAGALAGYAGGATDRVVVAATDTALAIPRVPFLLLLVALFEPGAGVTIVAIGVTGWMTVARLVRAEVRAVRTRAFVEAAHALGARPRRVLARHVLPHALAPALVAAALGVGNAIMLEAGLSFLGLGVQPPTPSWGNLIAAGRDSLVLAPWVALAPAAAVTLTVLACSVIADGLEAALAGRA